MAKPNVWSDYSLASASKVCRQIAMLSGEVGTGKTRYALTSPGPLLVQSLDKGTEGVVEDILAEMPDKKVYVKEYDWNPEADDFSQEAAIALRDDIITDFNFALRNARGCVWDKETDIWKVFRYAEFGGPSDAPKNYDKLNARYFHLINQAKSTPGFNFFLIQSMKDEWGSETVVDPGSGARKRKPIQTGKRVRQGFDRLDEIVFTEMHFRRENGQFFVDIGKCRQNSALMDQSMPAYTFAEFGTLLIPNTSEEDWQ